MLVDPWVGKIPWRRKWQPTPVSLAGKSHGQRARTCAHTHTHTHTYTLYLSLSLLSLSVLNQVRSGTSHLLTKEHLFGPSFSQPPNMFEPFLTP